jgi:hypothetical protein
VVLNPNSGCSDNSQHSYGFVSADVSAGVNGCAWAEHASSGADEFFGCGSGVGRSCYYDSCNDQSVYNDLVAGVMHSSTGQHQVNGRGEA